MIKKNNILNKYFLLIFLLLFISGNVVCFVVFGPYAPALSIILIYSILGVKEVNSVLYDPVFSVLFKKIVWFILFLTFFQLLVLGQVSLLGNINIILKIFVGGFIMFYFRENFPKYFFDVIYKLSIISLVFFFVVNILKINLPYLQLEEVTHHYFVYNTSFDRHWYKNHGMFWEPGAHAGILTLCLALNAHRFLYLLKNEKNKIITIALTLLTTQSTTGFLIFFVLVIVFFIELKNYFMIAFIFPFVILGAIVAYQTIPFLKDKVESQLNGSDEDFGDNQLNNTRFGSFEFDAYYIVKHPLVGNGLIEATRYADHLFLFKGKGQSSDSLGNGNGFSNSMASMGIPFVFGYFILLYRNSRKTNKLKYWLIVTVVFMDLWGEQWLNFPLFIGLPFLYFDKEKNKNIIPEIIKSSLVNKMYVTNPKYTIK